MSNQDQQKRNRIHLRVIVDRSGSMHMQWPDTVGGFAAFIKDLQNDDAVDYFLTLTVFDTVVESPIAGRTIRDVNTNILLKYGPRGGTALYDAIGQTLTSSSVPSSIDKDIVLIMTDGQENSSTVWTKDSIHALIDSKIREGRTTLQYIGAQPESWSDSAAIGVKACDTVQYSPFYVGEAYAAMSSGVRNFAASNLCTTRSLMSNFADEGIVKSANMKFTPRQIRPA